MFISAQRYQQGRWADLRGVVVRYYTAGRPAAPLCSNCCNLHSLTCCVLLSTLCCAMPCGFCAGALCSGCVSQCHSSAGVSRVPTPPLSSSSTKTHQSHETLGWTPHAVPCCCCAVLCYAVQVLCWCIVQRVCRAVPQ